MGEETNIESNRGQQGADNKLSREDLVKEALEQGQPSPDTTATAYQDQTNEITGRDHGNQEKNR